VNGVVLKKFKVRNTKDDNQDVDHALFSRPNNSFPVESEVLGHRRWLLNCCLIMKHAVTECGPNENPLLECFA
jgi:hypothetical protein